MDGTVECDASIMDATTLGYGAVGAIKGIKNPIKVAHCLLTEENKGLLSLGRVPPCFLTGDGAYTWAKEHGIEEIHPDKMITENALSSFKKYRQKLLTCTKRDCASTGNVHKKRKTDMVCIDNELLDTVGAISIDCHGNISSAVSSGGISLKQPGRVGQAAVYGCGCWAMKLSTTSVASSTTGCGEHLLKTMLARKCVESALGSECLDQAIRKVFQCDFLGKSCLIISYYIDL
uniref:Threonine aspartase 1-like n=1 Tax=Saccoglossus kowalevskii TaxID=10224 RepID=A0ABM0MHK2_SACKO|nr:PREDICTED: threonine aspartase 1-like [Saccoglossus kowalevskii]